jgi:hypothetical protein
VALGQPRAVGAEHERDVGEGEGGQAEARGEPELARGGVQEVLAADDLADPLGAVVDDDRQVVGERAVVAAHDEVVDDARLRAVDAVGEGDRRGVGGDAQRRRAPGRLALGALRRGQVAARAGVVALGQRAVRRRGRLADLRARAPAGVDEPVALQLRQRVGVEVQARGLPDDLAVPVDPDRREVGELLAREVRADPPGVEVLDPQQERRALGAGVEPRQQRRAQVAEVQRAGRRGGEAPGGVQARTSGRPVRQERGSQPGSAARARALALPGSVVA